MGVKRERTALHVEFTINNEQWLELGYWLIAIGLGAAQAWTWRFQPSTIDAVSYLDIGDAYVQGRWTDAINAYWNPLYSWILGVVMFVARPSAELEYPAAKLVDFTIYLLCLCSFAWFLRRLRLAYRAAIAQDGAAIPDWVWIAGGYTLFIWSSIRWIALTASTPDMSAAALTYGAWGLLLRGEQDERRIHYPLLGAILALGYFSRTPMFIVAVAMLLFAGSYEATPARRRGAIAAALVFLVLTAPFIVAISRARGHLTIGDNGKLNHAWLTNPGSYIIPNRHWQGGPPGYGYPKHPSRLVWDAPAAFEFATPIGGTFPPWTDPSYWYEGLKYHFDRAAEWRSLKHNLHFYDEMFGRWLLLGVVAVLVLAGDRRSTLSALARNMRYLAPAATGLIVYLIAADLLVQGLPTQRPHRYVAVFVVLLYLMMAASIRFRSVKHSAVLKWPLAVAVAAVSISMMTTLIASQYAAGQTPPMPPWQVARGLQETGVASGMRAATIGSPARHAFWARLARTQIIAEVPNDFSFWAKPPATQQLILRLLARTGAQVAVSSSIPMSAVEQGWRVASGSSYGVYVLDKDKGDAPSGTISDVRRAISQR